jgi:GTP-binding protein HflX
MRYRTQRQRSQIPIIALVGYTNAGKSTLLNRLARSDVFVANQLFATLDPTTRRVELPAGHWALITDTVGFIQKLPTQLVAAFRATLEEIAEADLLLHIVDASHPNAREQIKAVEMTLKEIDAGHIPVILVLNKSDRLDDREDALDVVRDYPGTVVAISALTGEGIPEMLREVERELYERFVPVAVRLPFDQGYLISLFHDQGQVDNVEHSRTGVVIEGNIPGRLLARFQPYIMGKIDETPMEEGAEALTASQTDTQGWPVVEEEDDDFESYTAAGSDEGDDEDI